MPTLHVKISRVPSLEDWKILPTRCPHSCREAAQGGAAAALLRQGVWPQSRHTQLPSLTCSGFLPGRPEFATVARALCFLQDQLKGRVTLLIQKMRHHKLVSQTRSSFLFLLVVMVSYKTLSLNEILGIIAS